MRPRASARATPCPPQPRNQLHFLQPSSRRGVPTVTDPDRTRELRTEYDEAVLNEGKELAGPFMTVSGRPIDRLYDPTDIAGLDYERDINLPGNYPFTRGIHPTGYRGKPWTILI